MTTLAQAETRAREVINLWTAGATLASFVPGSSFVLGAADMRLVSDVAAIFEVRGVQAEQVMAVLGATATGLTASELLSFVPVFGWIAKAAIAGGVTKALGEAVLTYMKQRSPLAPA